MEIARLVLDYLKVFAWPLLVVIVLLVARKSLPTFLADLAHRLESIKAGGAELKFSPAQQAALAAADQLSKATESATGAQSQVSDLSPDLRRLTPRNSASKIFRNMRLTLYSQVKQVCTENRLPVTWKGEPTQEPPSGIRLDVPRWEDISDTTSIQVVNYSRQERVRRG
jgi:Sec-independent protein translocase protein TatA